MSQAFSEIARKSRDSRKQNGRRNHHACDADEACGEFGGMEAADYGMPGQRVDAQKYLKKISVPDSAPVWKKKHPRSARHLQWHFRDGPYPGWR